MINGLTNVLSAWSFLGCIPPAAFGNGIIIDFDEAENSHDYLRYLDMMSGEITVRCEDGKGRIIRRSSRRSRRMVVVQEFKRQDGKKLDVTMRFVAPGGYELQDDFGEFVLVDFHEMYPIPGSSVQVQTRRTAVPYL